MTNTFVKVDRVVDPAARMRGEDAEDRRSAIAIGGERAELSGFASQDDLREDVGA